MPKESYNLILQSQITTNRIGTNKRNYQYMVNWSAVLPNPRKINQKYSVKFTFVTPVQASFAEMYYLNIDFGGSNVYSQTNSKINYLGNIIPTNNLTNAVAQATGSTTQTSYFYAITRIDDNPGVTIEYPNNNIITVDIVNANLSSGTTFPYEYILNLQFTPIED